jgi:penicillin V acylase-like amidase (Ntn superfamily)
MCTALTYFDSSARPYIGRTLEFPVLLPSQLGFVSAGTAFTSQVPGKDPVSWTAKHGFLAAGTPGDVTQPGVPIPPSSLLVFRRDQRRGTGRQRQRLPRHRRDAGLRRPGCGARVRRLRHLYYCTFVEKVADLDAAVATLSAIVNNFDRPRGATIDPPASGGEGITIPGVTGISTEYTTNSFLADTVRRRYYVRDYTALNWSVVDLTRLAGVTGLRLIPLASLDPLGGDVTDLLAGRSA